MKLIFVYNIDSNLFALITGTAHKLASPKTYQCNLCMLTYPLASMDKEWGKFIGSLPYTSVFLHRDEFNKQYPNQKNVTLPAVLTEDASGIRVLVTTQEINVAKNISELIKIIEHALPELPKQILYQCLECGLKYADEKIAKACEAWCKERKSCNLDIIKHAIEE